MTEWALRPSYKSMLRVRCARRFRQHLWTPHKRIIPKEEAPF